MKNIVKTEDVYDRTINVVKQHEKKLSEQKSNLDPNVLLGDITFLNRFKDKVISDTEKLGGRYSLLDRDMKTVESTSQVITELWKLPSNKSLQCLMGNMGSCDDSDEIIIGDEAQVDGGFKRRYIPKKLKKYGKLAFSYFIPLLHFRLS